VDVANLLTIRRSGEIDHRHLIQQILVRLRKLRQLVQQPPLLGFEPCPGVVCNLSDDLIVETQGCQIAGAVERMETGVTDGGPIADVVKSRRPHHDLGHPRSRGERLGGTTHCLHVGPPTRQRAYALEGNLLLPIDRSHASSLPDGLERSPCRRRHLGDGRRRRLPLPGCGQIGSVDR
jgi:hypothetical protein